VQLLSLVVDFRLSLFDFVVVIVRAPLESGLRFEVEVRGRW
jgi:hypothetical protein